MHPVGVGGGPWPGFPSACSPCGPGAGRQGPQGTLRRPQVARAGLPVPGIPSESCLFHSRGNLCSAAPPLPQALHCFPVPGTPVSPSGWCEVLLVARVGATPLSPGGRFLALFLATAVGCPPPAGVASELLLLVLLVSPARAEGAPPS